MTEIIQIEDRESLRAALEEVLADAARNNVDIEGALTMRTTDEEDPDWEIQIWEIE